MTDQNSTPAERAPRFKRMVEVALVLLPVVWILSAVVTGSFGLEPLGYFLVAIVVAVAAWIWIQHWGAYLALLTLGIASFASAQGYLILAFWIIGVLYITIALINLVPIAARRWRNQT